MGALGPSEPGETHGTVRAVLADAADVALLARTAFRALGTSRAVASFSARRASWALGPGVAGRALWTLVSGHAAISLSAQVSRLALGSVVAAEALLAGIARLSTASAAALLAFHSLRALNARTAGDAVLPDVARRALLANIAARPFVAAVPNVTADALTAHWAGFAWGTRRPGRTAFADVAGSADLSARTAFALEKTTEALESLRGKGRREGLTCSPFAPRSPR